MLIIRSYVSLREGLVRRLADLDLLSANDVQTVLPDLSIAPPWLSSGESLLVRTLRSHSHGELIVRTVYLNHQNLISRHWP
jgi:hypothetical protein